MNSFKEQCIALRKKDYSLLEIAHMTGRPKTSVFFHIKDIPLSTRKRVLIKNASGERIRRFALARKGKSEKPFKTFRKWTPRNVLLVAHLLFDGEIRYEGCIYHNRNNTLIKRVEDLMQDIYTFPPKSSTNTVTGVSRISYFNVELGAYLGHKSEELLEHITLFQPVLQLEFLRAFFDDEGCMDFRKKTRRIRGYQKDVSRLKIIQTLLLNFRIAASIKLPNEIVITGKSNLLRFEELINFSPGVRINGKRSNSVWKKNLEKREILKRAVVSFQS